MSNEIEIYNPGEVGPVNELTPSFDTVAPAPDLLAPTLSAEPDEFHYDRAALQNFLDDLDKIPAGKAVEGPGIQFGGRTIRVLGLGGAK